jgi:hypothetical protein
MRSLRAALWAAALSSALAVPAHAFKRSTAGPGGPCLFWASPGHSFMIDASATPDVSAADAYDAVRRSFATWAGVQCAHLTFSDQGLSTDPANRKVGYVPGGNNINLVLWRTANCSSSGVVPAADPCLTQGTCGNNYDCWSHGDNVIAVTTTTFDRTTGQIFDADIELNDSNPVGGSHYIFTTADCPAGSSTCLCTGVQNAACAHYDVQNTVTHEAGHSIGLDHTTVPDATMFAFAPEGEEGKRILNQDDIDGVCAIYPNGEPTTCDGGAVVLADAGAPDAGRTAVSSGGGCGSAPSAQGSSGAALDAVALALGCGALVAKRRRGRRHS